MLVLFYFCLFVYKLFLLIYFFAYRKIRKVLTGVLARVQALSPGYPVPGSEMVVESRSVIRNAKNAPAPFPKSCPSYFRFARFNTFPLYYLRAWHRLSPGSNPGFDVNLSRR